MRRSKSKKSALKTQKRSISKIIYINDDVQEIIIKKLPSLIKPQPNISYQDIVNISKNVLKSIDWNLTSKKDARELIGNELIKTYQISNVDFKNLRPHVNKAILLCIKDSQNTDQTIKKINVSKLTVNSIKRYKGYLRDTKFHKFFLEPKLISEYNLEVVKNALVSIQPNIFTY